MPKLIILLTAVVKDSIIASLCLFILFKHVESSVLSETPTSRNVSEGAEVEFTCGTSLEDVVLVWKPTTLNNKYAHSSAQPGGGQLSLLKFTATSNWNNTQVTCTALDGSIHQVESSSAILLVQGFLSSVGNLISSSVNSCTLRVTWTPPYTLHGVSIRNYTFNITVLSTGQVEEYGTTNTTDMSFSPRSINETFNISVAAVNDVGIGNSSSISTELQPGNMSLVLEETGIIRKGSQWIYTLSVQGMQICKSAIKSAYTRTCYGSECNISAVNDTNNLSEGNITAEYHFKENRKYLSTLHINYFGGVNLQSNAVEISTFDSQSITVTSTDNGRICLAIDYVPGHKIPPQCFIMLTCTTSNCSIQINYTITGSSGCIDIPPNTYTLSATDGDAVDSIQQMPALVVPVTVLQYSTTSHTGFMIATPTPVAELEDNITLPIAIVVSVVVLLVVSALSLLVFFIIKKHPKSFSSDACDHDEAMTTISAKTVNKQAKTIIYAELGEPLQGAIAQPPVGDVTYAQIHSGRDDNQSTTL